LERHHAGFVQVNAIDRISSTEPPLAMGVAPVPSDLLAEEYRRIVADHAAEQAADRRRERGQRWLVGGLLASTIALAGAVVVMLPMRQIMPVFVTLNGDGSYTTTLRQRELSQGEREATMKATLWLYTRARVGYSSASHPEDRRLVDMLSDKPTGNTYATEVSPKNPQSPWKKYDTRTVIRLERINEFFLCAHDNCVGRVPDAYQVRFRRIVETEGVAPKSQPWVAILRFRTVERIPAWQRTTYNPLGIQVIEFSSSEEGAAQ
jgi:type IV secretion system protein VirB8